ncbi:MAG: hypothetical protein RL150_53 [Candidatus Parcubacteria bacterium]|jgi:hypothetical protein
MRSLLTSDLTTYAQGLGLFRDYREGLYLNKIARRLGQVPRRFSPLPVEYRGSVTQVRINTTGGSSLRTETECNEFDGFTIGGSVTESGTHLFGFGPLIYVSQGEESWFELCPPESWFRQMPATFTFVPRAELHVKDGRHVLIAHFEE